MKCFSCKFYHHTLPCNESPYGEEACMKTEQDLFGCKDEDVENCTDYERKENKHYE